MRRYWIGLIFASLFLTACGQDFSGDYEGTPEGTFGMGPHFKYSFQNSGKVTIQFAGREVVTQFTREGKVVKVNDPIEGNVQLWNIMDDGTLDMGGRMYLKKVQ